MQRVEGCNVTTAKSTEEIIANIQHNVKDKLVLEFYKHWDWRDSKPVAIVGGGPSLKNTIKKLHDYQCVIACGSVHDYLIENEVSIRYCVVCDPDEIMIEYLKKDNSNLMMQYLVASQCSPKLFDYLHKEKRRGVLIWHAGGENLDSSVFGENKVMVGGGCTVGTRAIMLAMGMGYNNIHLFGFDTCLDENFAHHAYEFKDKERESIGNIYEVRLDGPKGKKFHVAAYHLGQLFDFQSILKTYADRIRVTVHGEGLLKHLMDLAESKTIGVT